MMAQCHLHSADKTWNSSEMNSALFKRNPSNKMSLGKASELNHFKEPGKAKTQRAQTHFPTALGHGLPRHAHGRQHRLRGHRVPGCRSRGLKGTHQTTHIPCCGTYPFGRTSMLVYWFRVDIGWMCGCLVVALIRAGFRLLEGSFMLWL